MLDYISRGKKWSVGVTALAMFTAVALPSAIAYHFRYESACVHVHAHTQRAEWRWARRASVKRAFGQ